MCWGFEISFRRKKEKAVNINVDDIDGLRSLYNMYGKDVPDAVFDDDYFEPGKRIPISKLKERSCLCPANTDVILDFAARVVMKELHGMLVDATLNERQELVKRAIATMMNDAIDQFKTIRFAGNGVLILVNWL